MIRLYFELARRGFGRYAAYPGATWAGVFERLIQRYGEERTLVVDLEEPAPPLQLEGARVVRVDGPRQWLRFRRDEVTAAQLTAAVASQAPLLDLSVEEPDIEDVVRRIYTEGL